MLNSLWGTADHPCWMLPKTGRSSTQGLAGTVFLSLSTPSAYATSPVLGRLKMLG